nr:MAG: rep protein [Cressdnaviricota sp.]
MAVSIFRFSITRKIDTGDTMKFVSPASKDKNEAVKCWFLTWPHCAIPKEEALRQLEKHGLDEYMVAEETHADGSPHLHAYIKLKKKCRFDGNRFNLEDSGKTYHGDYQKCKSVSGAIDYLQKEKNYIASFDVKAQKQHKAKILPDDYLRDPLDLLDEGKITYFQLNNFLKNQDVYKMLLARKTERPKETPPKKRHWWIYGNSNTGKTTYLRKQMDEIPGGWFQIPTNNDWKGYNSEKNLYLDEYKGQLSLQELNRICDGGAKVNTKGGSTMLAWDVTVWICSNYTIGGCYNKTEECMLECLYNRFQLCNLSKSIQLHPMLT